MVKAQNSTGTARNKPCFQTVFYKDVELFIRRDASRRPATLRLYDAESGWIVAAGTTPMEGRNEDELIQILDTRFTAVAKDGESFKSLMAKLRAESRPGEEQKANAKAYADWKARTQLDQITPANGRHLVQSPLIEIINPVAVTSDHQPRKEVNHMPEVQQKKRQCNLVLHCGASLASRVDVARVTTPKPTETWTPIPHVTLIEELESAMRATGLRIGNQVHSLNQEGAQYFGLNEVFGPSNASDYSLIVGLRNSHNKTFPVGLCAGATVFVCDNLSFSGEVRLTRKHTVHLQRDLPQLVSRGVGRLMDLWGHQGKRIDAYKNNRMRDKAAHDLVIRAVDLGACTNRMIPAIIKEWREPTYPDFKDRTAWSLFNAFTEVLKGNLPELPKRTESLHALFDTHVGLPAAHLN